MYSLRRASQFLGQPWEVQWRSYLVRLPWLVPTPVLHWTSPEGPHPIIIQLPSRGEYKIPVYIFIPLQREHAGKEIFPVHLDFHGGGFIMGSCLEQAPWCAQLARETGRVVLSVDYRKGPLDKFPAAIEDGEDVLAAVLDTEARTAAGQALRKVLQKRADGDRSIDLDHNNISLSGFSSGGNLALNLVLSVETASGPWPCLFSQQGKTIPTLLFYPSLDCRQLPHERPRPAKMKDDSGGWFPALGSVLGPTYLPAEQRAHPRASPGLNDMQATLNARSQIRLILPEIDTLAVQSEVWVDKMKDEGLEDRLVVCREQDMPHGWTQFPDSFLAEEAKERKYAVLKEAVDWLKTWDT